MRDRRATQWNIQKIPRANEVGERRTEIRGKEPFVTTDGL
jgi:hypothetical protein